MKIKAPLVVLQLLVGGLAVAGGLMMLTRNMELDQDWLQQTPFTAWTIPGIALLLLPGAGELLAAAAVLLHWPYARQVAIFSGLGLVAWILVQLLWMQVFHPVMHPLIGGIGIAITVLGSMWPPKAGLPSQRHVPGHANAWAFVVTGTAVPACEPTRNGPCCMLPGNDSRVKIADASP